MCFAIKKIALYIILFYRKCFEFIFVSCVNQMFHPFMAPELKIDDWWKRVHMHVVSTFGVKLLFETYVCWKCHVMVLHFHVIKRSNEKLVLTVIHCILYTHTHTHTHIFNSRNKSIHHEWPKFYVVWISNIVYTEIVKI